MDLPLVHRLNFNLEMRVQNARILINSVDMVELVNAVMPHPKNI